MLVGLAIVPAGAIFFELAIHHRQPFGVGIGLIVLVLASIAVLSWLHGWLNKVLLWAFGFTFALAGNADFSSESPVDRSQNAAEAAVQQALAEILRETSAHLHERFEKLEAILRARDYGGDSDVDGRAESPSR